jgi:hypothetical protein
MFWSRKKSLSPIDAAKTNFKRMLPICGVCNRPISGHLYKQIAVTPLNKNGSEGGSALINAVKALEWEKLVSFQEFRPLEDDVVAYVLKCPDSSYSLLAVLSPFELWQDDVLLHQEPVANHSPIIEHEILGPL